MEEGEKSKSWLIWIIIVPVCMAIGALGVKWAMKPFSRPSAPAPAAAEAQAPAPAPAPAQAPPPDNFELPGDEAEGKEAVVTWGKPAETAAPGAPAAAARAAAGDPEKDRSLGLVYGALTKAAEKLLGSPKAVNALLSNEYVVKGFMSRETVKKATASSASLAAYLKDPKNVSQFMNKPAVQKGINNQQLVDAVATSKLASALLDTPGGKALLNDPAAIAEVVKANPGLVTVLSNPALINALMQNPRTAGLAGQLGGSLLPR